ncbi:solute carrier organic anion transporter family member 1C1-like [Trichomycterus rosablanca]|uniref:solute carrier organic anion transporter family member 1C1-like n=1 Tax=Trichomycterus rosablanca TaxID=2290929 RepID=UPI002F358AEF
MFIVSLSFAYFMKAFSGSYMKSAITQIERRFGLSSSLSGLVDGSFEMGNLLFLALVSHFGAKMHRPRLIGSGCFLMAVGSAITGLPHFFMERYKYDTVIPDLLNENISIVACHDPKIQSVYPDLDLEHSTGYSAESECVKEPDSYIWVYVFLGNALRGIGETPVMPLGISYIDDFAKAENSAFYIACIQTITLLGPMFGYLMGSMCAKLYVDIGFVDTDKLSITPNDARWVGAWWLGFFVSSIFMLVAGIPFWFLPRSLPKQEEGNEDASTPYFGNQEHSDHFTSSSVKLVVMAKGFLPSLKQLLGTPTYVLLLCGKTFFISSLIGLFTFTAKYMELQFGQSASRANFLIGVLNLPAGALGTFLGGLLMKRYKLSVVSGAQLSFLTSFLTFLLILLQFGNKCDNVRLAGLTISYNGTRQISSDEQALFSECNQNCSCSAAEWDPVCSDDGITFMSPCLAGCTSSTGQGKSMAFHNCSCVLNPSPVEGSTSVSLGQCPHGPACSRSFTSYMAIAVLSFFICALGTTPAYMVAIRCISPELKSLAVGIQTLVVRTLGGISAPMYFGALIDSACLKWGMKKCGGRTACRIYDTDMYRFAFFGLMTCLFGCSHFFEIAVIILLRKQSSVEAVRANQRASQGTELQTSKQHINSGSEPCSNQSHHEGEVLDSGNHEPNEHPAFTSNQNQKNNEQTEFAEKHEEKTDSEVTCV